MTRSFSCRRMSLIARALTALALAFLLLPAAAPAKKKKKKEKNEALVTGKVVNQQQEVLAGIRVRVTSEADEAFEFEATTDKEGTFSLKVTDPVGEYAFHLEGDGYAAYDAKAPLVAGEEATIGFELLDEAAGRRLEAVKAFNAGVAAFNEENWAEAKVKFLKATELDPEMTEPYQGLAEIYYRDESLEEAAAAAEKVLATDSDDTNFLALAYRINQDLGNTARVEELIDVLSKTDKAKPLARQIYNDGVAATQTGDNGRAVERFRRAASLDPELAQAYSSAATVLYNDGQYAEALAMIEQLYTRDPENVQGRRIHYLVYDAMNDQPQAAKALDAYLAADPDGAVDVMYQRADLDFRDGNTAKAAAALERILGLRPEMARAHYTLGLIHLSSDKAKAKKHLQKFLELAPDDPEAGSAKEMLSYL